MTAHDVAAYILQKAGPMSTWKLQKLLYYSQAWSTVWDDRTLFDDRIEAWANGPVVRSVYNSHAGQFKVRSGDLPGDASTLDDDARDAVDKVLDFYGHRSSQWLSDLTHMERPWIDARHGLAPHERGDHEIRPEAMAEYYASITPTTQPTQP